MKRPVATSLLVAAILLSAEATAQGSSVTQTVTIEVKPMTNLVVTGNPDPLVVTQSTPGEEYTAVSDGNTSYSMLTNLDDMKIVASINSPMPSGTKLRVRLGSTRGLSKGDVDLSAAVQPVEVVTGIGRGTDRNQTITYTFAAIASITELEMDSRVITLTLTKN